MNIGCFIRENEEKTIVHKNFTAFLLEYAIMSPVRKTKSFAGMKTGKAGFPITALLKMEVKK